MSVLKARRRESAAEYVNSACKVFEGTLWFLSRLSNRYQRLLAADTMKLASETLDHCEKANNIRVTDDVTYGLRREHLAEAVSSVMALDVHLSYIWELLMENPQGAFTNTKGQTRPPAEAIGILDKMAASLGEEIDKVKNLTRKVIESDKRSWMGKQEKMQQK